MYKFNFKPLVALVAATLPFAAALLSGDGTEKTEMAVLGLRCEYLTNPLGIDVQKPRLSWVLNPAADARGQSAYRVLVASSPAMLQKDHGDLWDSGRVVSAQSTWIESPGTYSFEAMLSPKQQLP